MKSLFNNTWKQLMILWESPETFDPFRDIPKAQLGISTSVQDLPLTKPYGFWVDRHGNFILVPYQRHGDTSEELYYKMRKWMQSKKITPPEGFTNSVIYGYSFLLDRGWMRVVTYSSSMIFMELRGTPSSGQTKFLKILRDLYFEPDTPIARS